MFKLVSQPSEWQKTGARTAISPRAEAYQSFWETFLQRLGERAPGFTHARKGLPQSWYNVGAGRSGFAYGTGFRVGGRFAVELYIDTGDREKNKEFFDRLHGQRESIEKELHMTLSWERLDEARASRIAAYREGTTTSPEAELDELRNWGVATLIEFRKAFARRVRAL